MASPIRLLTLNVFIRPPGINNNGNDYKDERLEGIIGVLPYFDVVCFQELFAFGSTRRTRFLKKAESLGFVYSVASPPASLFSFQIIDGGLCILSRFPIVKHDFTTFDRGVGVDGLAAKGCLYALIKTADHKEFHVVTTHLQASYASSDGSAAPGSNANQAARRAQLRHLGTWMGGKIRDHPHIPCVLLGDMNVDGRPRTAQQQARTTASPSPAPSLKAATPSTSPGEATEAATAAVSSSMEGSSTQERNERNNDHHSTAYGEMTSIISSSLQRATTISCRWVGSQLDDDDDDDGGDYSNDDGGDTSARAEGDIVVRDLLFDTLGYHPITVGDIVPIQDSPERCPRETQLTHRNDYCCAKSLDYIFLVLVERAAADRTAGSVSKSDNRSPGQAAGVHTSATSVEEFFVSNLLHIPHVMAQNMKAQSQHDASTATSPANTKTNTDTTSVSPTATESSSPSHVSPSSIHIPDGATTATAAPAHRSPSSASFSEPSLQHTSTPAHHIAHSLPSLSSATPQTHSLPYTQLSDHYGVMTWLHL